MKNAFIKNFLKKATDCLENNRFKLIRRDKNNEFITNKGYTEKEIKAIIKNLELSNFIKGPEEDKNSEHEDGEVWIFQKNNIYIKLKLYYKSNKLWLKCISFHD